MTTAVPPRRSPRTWIPGLCLAFFLAALASVAFAQDDVILTNAAQVRALSSEDAAKGLPVELRGVVTMEAEGGSGFVVFDETESIYLLGEPGQVVEFRRGDWLEIEGVSGPGGFAPIVVVRSAGKLGERGLPPPEPATFEQLIVSRFDGQWVEVAGIVRSCEPVLNETGRTAIELATGGQILAVHVNRAIPSGSYVDAQVRVRGVCFNRHNVNRQFISPVLHIPRDEPILVDKPAPAEPFEMPRTSVANLMQFAPDGSYGHRVRVRGVVTHHQSGEQLWIREGDRGLRIRTSTGGSLQPGEVVDILGFPNRGVYTPMIEDAVFRVAATNAPPVPFDLKTLTNAPAHDGDLIAIEATLTEVKSVVQGGFRAIDLTLDWAGEMVNASWRPREDETVPEDWRVGSLVRVAGICIVTPEASTPPVGLLQPRFFQVLLRSPRDLAVVKSPAWWTAERKMWIASSVAAVLLFAVGGVSLAARRRLREQAARRATAEAEFSAILTERNRMAREIHDTLAQGLGAISMQLELAKDKVSADANGLGTHLETARQLVRSSLAEARRSIWNMRSQVLETGDLATALEGILLQLAGGTGTQFRMKVNGTRRRLPAVTENNLLRIGQEAITNAFKHSGASRIDVTLDFREASVTLRVADNGHGFDPQATRIRNGSFGLTTMRERAALLHADLRLSTTVGQGTVIALDAPTSSDGRPKA